MRRTLFVAMFCLAGCASAPAPIADMRVPHDTAQLQIDVDLARISEWFAGEFDNYAQVAAARDQPSATAHERIHLSMTPVEVPSIGGAVFFARQTLDDDPQRLFRLRLYRFAVDRGTIRLDQYRFNDEAPWRGALDPAQLKSLPKEALSVAPDCAVYFRYDAERSRFVGATETGRCRVASERFAAGVVVEDRMEIAADEVLVASSARDGKGQLIYGHPQGVPHRHRRAQWFGGLVVVNDAGRSARADQRSWHTLRDVRLHNEGGSVALTGSDGRRIGASLRLARLPLGNDPSPALILYVIDDASGQPIAYAIADADASRIGINLKWVQVSLALAPTR